MDSPGPPEMEDHPPGPWPDLPVVGLQDELKNTSGRPDEDQRDV